MANVNKVIKIALEEVGYLEKKSNNQLDDKTANAGSNNYTKYGRDMHNIYPSIMDFPAYWCDCFVDWCFQKAYGISTAKSLLCGNFDDYTIASAQMYKNKNAYIKRGQNIPKIGDQIFFNNGTKICHTGLVYNVDDKKVYTIEGNTNVCSTVISNGGGVFKKEYLLTYNKIDGYGRPKYDNKENKGVSSIKVPMIAKPTIREGSIGSQAKYLQQDLNYLGSKLIVDGNIGNITITELKLWQKKNGLINDGVYGKLSHIKMKQMIK